LRIVGLWRMLGFGGFGLIWFFLLSPPPSVEGGGVLVGWLVGRGWGGGVDG